LIISRNHIIYLLENRSLFLGTLAQLQVAVNAGQLFDDRVEDVVLPRVGEYSHTTKISDPTPLAVMKLEKMKSNKEVQKRIDEYQAMIARIDAAVPYLQGDHGKALRMRYYEGMSLRQICGHLKFAYKSSVYRCIRRGIDELMLMLNPSVEKS